MYNMAGGKSAVTPKMHACAFVNGGVLFFPYIMEKKELGGNLSIHWSNKGISLHQLVI